MDIDKLQIEPLDAKSRKILFGILGISLSGLECYYCKKKLNYKDCGIMPSLSNQENARIVCGSPLCFCEFFDDYKSYRKKK